MNHPRPLENLTKLRAVSHGAPRAGISKRSYRTHSMIRRTWLVPCSTLTRRLLSKI